jgi:hypothetical protein
MNLLALTLKLLYGVPYTRTTILGWVLKRTFHNLKNCATPATVKNPDLVYKVNKKQCQQYLDSRVKADGMWNLTSKYHTKK